MRRAFFFVSLLGASLVPSLALADDEPPPPLPAPSAGPSSSASTASTTVDAVHLRNGGFYRGRVTEIVPGDHVTVVVAPGGETKRIPWADVDRVIVASTPVPPVPTPSSPTPSAPAASPPTPPAPMVGPRARVHITAPKQVILYRKAAGTSTFQQACTSPCDIELPIGDTYKLAGNGLSQNKELHLAAGPGGFVDIVVDPPSTGGMILGGFVAGAGATAAYVGLLLAIVGQADASGNSCYGTYTASCADKESEGETVRNAGLVTMVVGVGLTVLGVVVFINNASTDISQRTGASATMPANDAFVRKPTWRSVASSSESATGAPAAAFPLVFTHRF